MIGTIKNWLVKTTNDLTPAEIPKESVFLTDGRLTPLEFTQAGDRLILASKMWQWQKSSKKGKEESTLDKNKQYLKATTISKCRLSDDSNELTEIKFEDEWQVMGNNETKKPINFEEEKKIIDKPKVNKIKNFEDSDSDPEIEENKPESKQDYPA